MGLEEEKEQEQQKQEDGEKVMEQLCWGLPFFSMGRVWGFIKTSPIVWLSFLDSGG